MADGEHESYVLLDKLWDSTGREYTRKHSAWLSRKQADAFASRRDVVAGLVVSPGLPVQWLSGTELRSWWQHAEKHFEQPGRVESRPDDEGRTWSAHLWHRGDDRLLVFDEHC